MWILCQGKLSSIQVATSFIGKFVHPVEGVNGLDERINILAHYKVLFVILYDDLVQDPSNNRSVYSKYIHYSRLEAKLSVEQERVTQLAADKMEAEKEIKNLKIYVKNNLEISTR